MLNIKILGRGGQGVVSSSYALANALFREGHQVQAFPMYGVERAGGPARAFVRVDKKPIIRYDGMYEPNVFLILDPTLVKEEYKNFVNSSGLVIINSSKDAEAFNLPADRACIVLTIDATEIGREAIGKPLFNTAMLGAFAGVSGIVSIKSINLAIEEIWGDKGANVVKGNQKAVEMAFESMKKIVNGKKVALKI